MRNIYIMSGIPGSGKTHYTLNYAGCDDVILHRDDFRAELREREGKPNVYFPVSARREWKMWIERIGEALSQNPNVDVWIDSTTLTNKALIKLLESIRPFLTNSDWITVFVCWCSLPIAQARNHHRAGFACVPDHVQESMYKSMQEDFISYAEVRRRLPNMVVNVRHIVTE